VRLPARQERQAGRLPEAAPEGLESVVELGLGRDWPTAP
jgi:hypothetical protein